MPKLGIVDLGKLIILTLKVHGNLAGIYYRGWHKFWTKGLYKEPVLDYWVITSLKSEFLYLAFFKYSFRCLMLYKLLRHAVMMVQSILQPLRVKTHVIELIKIPDLLT